MLLKALHEFAYSRHILDDLGFEDKPVRWIIPLDRNGCLVGNGLIETEGERNRGKLYPAPRTSRAKDAGGVAEFLADGLTAIFGLDAEPDKKMNESQRRDRDFNNARKYDDFWCQIEEAATMTGNSALSAIRSFGENLWQQPSPPSFLRYGLKAGSDNPHEKQKWWVRCAEDTEKAMGPDAFSFAVDGVVLLFDEEKVRPYWRKVYENELTGKAKEASRGICLVTGQKNVPLASTNLPKIKGVPNTQSFGATVVSFDKPSFTSYGFDQGSNAPISLDAVAAYCNGLNSLLKRDDHSITIGSTALCFWAKESEESTSFIARMLRRPDPLAVADFLRLPWAGIDRHANRLDQFYSVTLCGNAGRIAVRHWLQTTVEEAQDNFETWFRDLQIDEIPVPKTKGKKGKKKSEDSDTTTEKNSEKMPPLAIFRLACTTVREAKDLRPEVSAQLYQAALEGTTPSVMLIKPLLHRLIANLQKFGLKTLLNDMSRFALLKLILNRNNRKEGDPMMIEPKVFETDDQAYNCGRLLAVLAEIQAKAHDYQLSGAGVAERYFGTASVSPASVFPLLLRLNRHHLDKIRKASGSSWNQEGNIQEILCLLSPDAVGAPPQFPRHLNLQAQGRFAIGFYQQKAEIEKRKQDARVKKANSSQEEPHDQG
jgi:CRISPR-associated protein Csd1